MDQLRIITKLDVFIDFTKSISQLSVSKTLKVGAIALQIDFSDIASFGYNGSFAGDIIKPDTGFEESSLEPGNSGFVHAEMNLCGKFKKTDAENYIILLTHSPCEICTKLLVNTGFRYIYWNEYYRNTSHLSHIFNTINYKYFGSFDDLKTDYSKILKEYYERKYPISSNSSPEIL